jgi:hypothetical protein
LAGVMLCWLGISLPMPAPATTSSLAVTDVPSALAGASNDVGHMGRGATNAPAPSPDDSYLPVLSAEEVDETTRLPVNAYLLMVLVLAVVSLGASVLWLLTANAPRQGAIRSLGVEARGWPNTGDGRLSFLGVCRL